MTSASVDPSTRSSAENSLDTGTGNALVGRTKIKKLCVLIVDGESLTKAPYSNILGKIHAADEKSQRLLLKAFLEKWGARVLLAADGRSALRRITRTRDRGGWIGERIVLSWLCSNNPTADCILMDINMSPVCSSLTQRQSKRCVIFFRVWAASQPHKSCVG
jgi:CheY-like chemotaxis protein